MKFKPVHIQFLLAFIMFLQPVAIFAQYIEAEISITISGSTYFPSKSNFKDVITEKTTIQGRVPGEIVRRRVEGYVKNPETRITECDASTYCPVITGSSEFAVRNDTNYAIVISDKLYPLYVQKSITSKGYRFINKKTGNIEEKIVKTENFSASGENNVEGLSLNISAFHAPSGQIAPLVPGYVMKVSGGKYLSRIRETPVGDGEWLRWDDEKETLSPENQPLGIGIPYLIADPSHELFDNEIYDQLLIRNYRQLDTFMLDPADKIFVIQASGKRYLKSDYSEYEGQIEVSINLAPFGFMRKPTVEIIGCTEIGAGEESVVTAKASKEGGSYRFWAEPQEMFSIEANGSTATIRGSSHGRGKLFVEYVSADGKKAEASKVAACIQLETYNGGQKIPQIALFDIDGKKLDGILNVPVEIKPNDAADLLSYVPANLAVLTAVGLGDVVTIQGVLPGKTTIQATTNCGATTGPAVEVEVVNCDDETIARLEKMKKAAIENLVAATKDLQSMAGSKEFEKARDELVSSYVELLAKVGLTIVSSGKTTGVVTKVVDGKEVISKAIPFAAEIADKGSALSEIIGSSNMEELGGNVAKPTSGEAFERIVKLKFGDAAKELYGKSLGAITGLVEVGQAADKFYDNVGQLVHHEEVLEKFMKIMEKAERDLEYIKSRQNICSRQKGESDESEIPLADLPPVTDKPTAPSKPTPKTQEPPVQKPQNNETQAEPTIDDEILVDPEPPAIPPRQVGLPFEQNDCGCSNSKDLTVTSTDFSTLGAGIKNLGDCSKNFTSISVSDYKDALTELSELTGSLSTILQTDAAAFLFKAKESKPQIDALVNRVKTYDEAGKAFLDKMEKCPESVSTGMEIFQSVEQITVDSIKTKY